MVSWSTFRSRRRLNLPIWAKNVGIRTSDDLQRVLRDLGVAMPADPAAVLAECDVQSVAPVAADSAVTQSEQAAVEPQAPETITPETVSTKHRPRKKKGG